MLIKWQQTNPVSVHLHPWVGGSGAFGMALWSSYCQLRILCLHLVAFWAHMCMLAPLTCACWPRPHVHVGPAHMCMLARPHVHVGPAHMCMLAPPTCTRSGPLDCYLVLRGPLKINLFDTLVQQPCNQVLNGGSYILSC